jgi:D-glycero-alpha-D-manno-heptose 1-phosphate guanylyltransferase
MMEYHQYVEADCTLALKPMQNFDRYGVVEIDEEHRIRKFREKQHYASGLINGGVYMLKAAALLGLKLGEKFSFEKDYLEQYCSSQRMFGFVQNEYFIDIGVPEDFSRANVELGIG